MSILYTPKPISGQRLSEQRLLAFGFLLSSLLWFGACCPSEQPATPATTDSPASDLPSSSESNAEEETGPAETTQTIETQDDTTQDTGRLSSPADVQGAGDSNVFGSGAEEPTSTNPIDASDEEWAQDLMFGHDLQEPQPPELGKPLVDSPEDLLMLDPKAPIWLTADRKSVVMQGRICQNNAMLEFFVVTTRGKTHESIVAVDAKPHIIQAGLIATGAEPGYPVSFYPEFKAAEGPLVDIEVRWTDEQGKRKSVPAQQLITNMRTKKPMEESFVFAGSRFIKNEDTGEEFFLATREGDIVSVANFPSAILDVAIRSSSEATDLIYQADPETVPELGTSVTLILTPHTKTEDNTTGSEVSEPVNE